MVKLTKLTSKTKLKDGIYLVKRNDEKSTKVNAVTFDYAYDIMTHKNGKWYNNFDLAFHYPTKCVDEFILIKHF